MPFDDRDFPNLPKGERAISPRSRRLVAIWLYSIACMILVMVALGGATRLTGSGLSIMEWAPFMGAIPPLSDTEWHRLYALYQQIPQYQQLNDGFGLAGFQHIFWLEWTHRLWGRLIGVAFVLPLIWFTATRRLEPRLLPRLVGFFVLGGMQGAVGWFMVESGFFPDAISVAPVRLVAHLTLALILYATVLWTALALMPPGPRIGDASRLLRGLTWTTLSLVALTIVAGGFVAGLHAGLAYNTFPLMDGHLVPEGYANLEPFGLNLIANIPAVQFNHRVLATLTVISASSLAIVALPYRGWLGWRAGFLAAAAALQYGLGVTTLLLAAPAWIAVSHQIGATILLTAVLLLAHALRYPAVISARTIPGSGRASGARTGSGRAHGQTAQGTPFYGSITSSASEDPKQ